MKLSRRTAIAGAGAGVAASFAYFGRELIGNPASAKTFDLVAKAGRGRVRQFDINDAFLFNGSVAPAPLVLDQNTPHLVRFANELDTETTIHWHGLRPAHAMDGVAGVTQAAIKPGKEFNYTLVSPDAGTFWLHPHVSGFKQVGRGLACPLIVRENYETGFASDYIVMLQEWCLNEAKNGLDENFLKGFIRNDFKNYDPFFSCNGAEKVNFESNSGDWARLRLVQAGLMTRMTMTVQQGEAWVVAYDGHPTTPKQVTQDFDIWPGQRIDLAVRPNGSDRKVVVRGRGNVFDPANYPALRDDPQMFVEASVEFSAPKSNKPCPVLKPNPVPIASHTDIEDLELRIALTDAPAIVALAGKRPKAPAGYMDANAEIWTLNGRFVGDGIEDVICMDKSPLFALKQGQTYRLNIHNDSEEPHPIHLHGHVFQRVEKGGVPAKDAACHDTLHVEADSELNIVFVADRPGDWMLHCHNFGHQMQRMMHYIRVV